MKLDELVDGLRRSLAMPLPGALAHEPLRAMPSGSVIPRFEHKLPPKPGSVLILLYEQDGRICFPLIKRQEYKGAHSGQISLPGGKAEAGETPEDTALREAAEEVGINPSHVDIIGRLSEFFVIPSNFMVQPIVAYQSTTPSFRPDPVEVDRILSGSIDELVRENAVQRKEILVAQQFRMNAPHFLISDEIVWGATAMMLNEFREVVRRTIF